MKDKRKTQRIVNKKKQKHAQELMLLDKLD